MDFCKEKEVLERQKMRGLELFDFEPLFLLITMSCSKWKYIEFIKLNLTI